MERGNEGEGEREGGREGRKEGGREGGRGGERESESESEIHLYEPHSIIQKKYFNVISIYKTWIGRPLLRPSGRYRREGENREGKRERGTYGGKDGEREKGRETERERD